MVRGYPHTIPSTGATARQVLSARAAFIRERLPDFALRLSATQIALESNARLPGDYAAGHALGLTYSLDGLPDEQTLAADLRSTLQAYRALTFRGGLDTEPETEVVSLEAPRNRGFYFA